MEKLTGTGLPNVYVIDGVVEHPDSTVSYRDLDGLYVALTRAITARATPLTAAELRFLRKRLKMTQADVGRLGGKTGQVAAMWEKGTRPVPVAEGNMMRLAWMARHDKRGLAAAIFAMEADDGHVEPCCVYVLRYVDGSGWTEAVEEGQALAQEQMAVLTNEAIESSMRDAAVERHYTIEGAPLDIAAATTVVAPDIASHELLELST
ncbi:hypothetical protein [Variovorax guangxiensis]|uniref:hypothetical protein n=1 Tax=Variovorax guangxiensis TaxID=1775474 RepID=UPI00285C3964|nr:hypothetical protein [Variovorax guangxiensis]MDR6857240.1 DNA-binding transcriptional regulator YiaG [Variovorax guangxiensis]